MKEADISRPEGEVDLLIGYDYAAWHPVKEQESRQLLILGNCFGKCIGGKHTLLHNTTQKFIYGVHVVNIIYKRGITEDFLSTESLGVKCIPRCGGCRCGTCPVGGKEYTLKEERELNLISNNLSFTGNHWIAKYLWIQEARALPDNYHHALRVLQKN